MLKLFRASTLQASRRNVLRPRLGTSYSVATVRPASSYAAARSELDPWRTRLLEHPLYGSVKTLSHVKAFMNVHSLAVWDFMSLLKALQRQFAPSRVPWVQPASLTSARLINEIVLGEETDEFKASDLQTSPVSGAASHNVHISHTELYLRAMRQIGADTSAVEQIMRNAQKLPALPPSPSSADYQSLFDNIPLDKRVQSFVQTTLSFCGTTVPPQQLASAFFFGREDPIPSMFQRVLDSMSPESAEQASLLRLYMIRHIEVDGGQHGPMAQRLLEEICGTNDDKWSQVVQAGKTCIDARLGLWDAALDKVRQADHA
jgi:hypothetical protein